MLEKGLDTPSWLWVIICQIYNLIGVLAKLIYFHLTLTPSPFPSPETRSGEGKGCPAGTGMG
jgi:hypothetical protein